MSHDGQVICTHMSLTFQWVDGGGRQRQTVAEWVVSEDLYGVGLCVE